MCFEKRETIVKRRLNQWHFKVVFNILWISRMPFDLLYFCLFPSSLSAAYIKVYLLENGICIAKKKTKSVRKSLDPLYNQVLVFSESPQGKVVQVNSIFTFCEENEGYLCKTPPEDASEGLPFYCSPSQKFQVLKYLALGLAWAIEIVLLAL